MTPAARRAVCMTRSLGSETASAYQNRGTRDRWPASSAAAPAFVNYQPPTLNPQDARWLECLNGLELGIGSLDLSSWFSSPSSTSTPLDAWAMNSPRELENAGGRSPRIRRLRVGGVLVALRHARPIAVDTAPDVEAGLCGRVGRR